MEKKQEAKFIQLVKVEDALSSQDFNGEHTLFSIEKQKEYLQKLAQLNSKEYGDCSCSLVSEDECDALIEKVQLKSKNEYRSREVFTGKAWLESDKKMRSCILYTKKTSLVGKTIVLQDGDNYPTPAAKLQTTKNVKFAQFTVDMGKEFETMLRGGIWTMVPGRIIEFRKGILEVLKIQFYSDGSCCARIGEPDEWHHNNILLGKIDYKKPFTFSVQFDGNFADIIGLGERKKVKILTSDLPDTVFISGGMCIANTWSVTPLQLKTQEGQVWDPFESLVKDEVVIEQLGEVTLPYVVGTEKNRDKTLVIEKEIDYEKSDKNIFLTSQGLDPDGEIYINGVKVVDSKDMMGGEWDITSYLKEGKNVITLRVNPRAPEILYSWHKHQDPYNGWFAGETYLEKRATTYVKQLQVKTLSTKNMVEGLLSLQIHNLQKNTFVECYAYDGNDEILLQKQVIEGSKVEVPFAFNGTCWSSQNPKLYDIVIRLFANGNLVDEYVERVGFRTIEQKNGDFYLNGEKEILKGALLMQFLPPYDEIPLNHVCPSDKQIVWQALLAKKMGCNTVRMHQLGYGTNDKRFARIFDALGLQVIWTTRLIDSVSNMCWSIKWAQKEYYKKQILEVINNPSIIMWEGANEYYLLRTDIDDIYREFVQGVKEVDDTRLIIPVSHLYYGNDSYDKGCEYYQDNGKQDEYFRNVQACKEWNDDKVVRSAHTYDWLLGYGKDWKKFRLQDWSAQPSLLASKNHAYMISEYAIIGYDNPEFLQTKKQSYELGDIQLLGYDFSQSEWKLSQAYQALAARYATKYMLANGADGMLWCCLTSGANDTTYLKPPIDFTGHPKQAFYALKECFQDIVCFDDGCDVVWGKVHTITPVLIHYSKDEINEVSITIYNEKEEVVDKKTYVDLPNNEKMARLPSWEVSLQPNQYYTIKYVVNYVK